MLIKIHFIPVADLVNFNNSRVAGTTGSSHLIYIGMVIITCLIDGSAIIVCTTHNQVCKVAVTFLINFTSVANTTVPHALIEYGFVIIAQLINSPIVQLLSTGSI